MSAEHDKKQAAYVIQKTEKSNLGLLSTPLGVFLPSILHSIEEGRVPGENKHDFWSHCNIKLRRVENTPTYEAQHNPGKMQRKHGDPPDIVIDLPSLPVDLLPEYNYPIVRLGHCGLGKKPNLHGQIDVISSQVADLQNLFLVDFLKKMGISHPVNTSNKTILFNQGVISEQYLDTFPHLLIDSVFYQSLLGALGYDQKEANRVYFDKQMQIELFAALKLCLDKFIVSGKHPEKMVRWNVGNNSIVMDEDSAVFIEDTGTPGYFYQQLLIDPSRPNRKRGPFFLRPNYTYSDLREDLTDHVLRGAGRSFESLSDVAFRTYLRQYYNPNELMDFIHLFPKTLVELRLSRNLPVYQTNPHTVLDFSEFRNRLNAVSQQMLPSYPSLITSVNELEKKFPSKYFVSGQEKNRLLVIFSSDSGMCDDCKKKQEI